MGFTEVNQVSESGCPGNAHMKYSKPMRIKIWVSWKYSHEIFEVDENTLEILDRNISEI